MNDDEREDVLRCYELNPVVLPLDIFLLEVHQVLNNLLVFRYVGLVFIVYNK